MPHFKEGFVIGAAIIIIVSVGGLLYIFGDAALPSIPIGNSAQTEQKPDANNFTVLTKGDNAQGVSQRVNYRITSADELNALWREIYGGSGPAMPAVDFSKQEVLAIFDGSHSTNGYGVTVTRVREDEGLRIIDITYSEPDTNCTLDSVTTSPFVLIAVKKTSLPLTTMKNVSVPPCQ